MFTRPLNLKNSYNVKPLSDTSSEVMLFKAKQTFNIIMAIVITPISLLFLAVSIEQFQAPATNMNWTLLGFTALMIVMPVILIFQCLKPATIFIDRDGIAISKGMWFKPKYYKFKDIHAFIYSPGTFTGRSYIPPMISLHEKNKVKPSYTLAGKFHKDMKYLTERLNSYADQHDGDEPYEHCSTLMEEYNAYNKKILIVVSILFFGFYAAYLYFKLT